MSLDSMLGGSSLPAVKFSNPDRTPNIGHHVSGVVLDAVKQQSSDMDGNPKTFSDGNPIMQLVVTLQTDERDDDNPTDDGRRSLYCTWNCEKAIRDAVTKASAEAGRKVEFDRGGRLVVQLTGTETPKVKGHTGAYIFAAKYTEGSLDAVLDEAPTAGPVRSIDDLA